METRKLFIISFNYVRVLSRPLYSAAISELVYKKSKYDFEIPLNF